MSSFSKEPAGLQSQQSVSDMIYSRFFESMLKENRGHDKEIDDAIEELLKELTPHKAAEPKKAEPKKRKTRI